MARRRSRKGGASASPTLTQWPGVHKTTNGKFDAKKYLTRRFDTAEEANAWLAQIERVARPLLEVPCRGCGEMFLPESGAAYCSKKCMPKRPAQSVEPYIAFTASGRYQAQSVSTGKYATFDTIEEARDFRGEPALGRLHHRNRTALSTATCTFCGESFETAHPTRAHYCGKKCNNAARAQGIFVRPGRASKETQRRLRNEAQARRKAEEERSLQRAEEIRTAMPLDQVFRQEPARLVREARDLPEHVQAEIADSLDLLARVASGEEGGIGGHAEHYRRVRKALAAHATTNGGS